MRCSRRSSIHCTGRPSRIAAHGIDEVLRIELAAHAEAAPHFQLHEVDEVLGMAEEVGEDAPVEVRHLGHAPQAQHAGAGVVGGGQAPGLDGHAGVALDGEALPHAVRGGGQRGPRVALVGLQAVHEVAADRRVEHGRAGLERAPRVGDGVQRLVVDLHQVERVLGQVPALGDHHGHRLAHVADFLARERQLQALDRADAVTEARGDAADGAEILAGHHGHHAGQRERRLRPDRAEARVGVRRAQDRGLQHAGQAEVGGVLAAPREEPRVLLAPHRLAERACHHGRGEGSEDGPSGQRGRLDRRTP